MQDFEVSLQQLEQLVEKMETGKLSLEENLACFEKGIKLTAHCQQILKTAEQRITEIADNNGILLEMPFTGTGDGETGA